MTALSASLLDVVGIVLGVVVALTGASLLLLGAMTVAEGRARRGLVVVVVGIALGLLGLWQIGIC